MVRSPSPSRCGRAWTQMWSLWHTCPQVRPSEVPVKPHGAKARHFPVCCRLSKPEDRAACSFACCQKVQRSPNGSTSSPPDAVRAVAEKTAIL